MPKKPVEGRGRKMGVASVQSRECITHLVAPMPRAIPLAVKSATYVLVLGTTYGRSEESLHCFLGDIKHSAAAQVHLVGMYGRKRPQAEAFFPLPCHNALLWCIIIKEGEGGR